MVKQWQQLLQNKLPNGATPIRTTPTTAVPTLGKASVKEARGLKVERTSSVSPTRLHLNSVESSNSVTFSHRKTHIASPNPLSSSLSSSSLPEDSTLSQQFKSSHSSTSSSYGSSLIPSESDSSQEVSSGYHSRDPPSTSPTPPSSPTPPYTTQSSRPAQPVSVNPTKNRFKIMQMLSSVKKLSPSPSPSKDTLTQSNSTGLISPEPHHPVSLLDSSSFATINSASSAGTQDQSYIIRPSSPPGSSAGVKIHVSLDTNSSISNNNSLPSPNSRWISDKSEFYCSPDFAALPSIGGISDTSALNGSRDYLDIVKDSRKRPRSYSPLSLNSSTPPPKHKRHKRHKHSSVQNKPEERSEYAEECIVQVPLEKVLLKDLQCSPKCTTKVGHVMNTTPSPVNHAQEYCQLVVSFQLSLLNRVPPVFQSARTINCFETTNSSLPPSHRPESYEVSLPPSDIHGKNELRKYHTDADSSKSVQFRLQVPKSEGDRHTQLSAIAEESTVNGESNTLTCPSPPRDVPPDVCPGVHGCVARDGHWYEWTDHIRSHGPEVTILPYVYIDF